MQSNGTISVLSIAQDNLFAEVSNCHVDHVPTGATITPFGAQRDRVFRRLPAILTRVLRGKYDLIVLPAVDFSWQYDNTFIKRAIRSIVANVLRFRRVSTCVNRLLSRRATKVIILDRYDSHEPLLDYFGCVTCAQYYFKTNLLQTDDDRRYPIGLTGECRFTQLPYWIAIDNYQVPFQADKDIDIFFAGAVNCQERRVSIDTVRQLESEGYRIKIVEGHLPFAEYLSLMSRSWLTLSPQGYGFNGFRHYESMLVGSVPLINRPDPPVVNDFRHGENCFMYSIAQGDLNQVIKSALKDKTKMLQMARRLRGFVVNRHSMRAVGERILQQTFENCSRSMKTTAPKRPVVADNDTLRREPRWRPASDLYLGESVAEVDAELVKGSKDT